MSFKERDESKELLNSQELRSSTLNWMIESSKAKYTYTKDWMGLPIIQRADDIIQLQEIIWDTKPDIIIETGIARAGSISFSASMLALLDTAEGKSFKNTKRRVIGIDLDIRKHAKDGIKRHPFSEIIYYIEGSSTDKLVLETVKNFIPVNSRVMVVLDSNHTHNHVLAEIEFYAPLVSVGNYCVVFDTIIEDVPAELFPNRPWGPGNNPKTAVWEYLKTHPEFEIDKNIQNKLLITVAPDGYLKRIS